MIKASFMLNAQSFYFIYNKTAISEMAVSEMAVSICKHCS